MFLLSNGECQPLYATLGRKLFSRAQLPSISIQKLSDLLPQAPAHTDGDTAVLLPSANVLVLGDLFTNGSYPVIDESSGGSLRGMIEALERLLTIIDSGTAVVPGHGPMGNRRALIDFRDMLHGIEDRILELVNSGSTPSEIIRAAPTSDHDQLFGRGYVTGDLFTRMVLAGLHLASANPTLR